MNACALMTQFKDGGAGGVVLSGEFPVSPESSGCPHASKSPGFSVPDPHRPADPPLHPAAASGLREAGHLSASPPDHGGGDLQRSRVQDPGGGGGDLQRSRVQDPGGGGGDLQRSRVQEPGGGGGDLQRSRVQDPGGGGGDLQRSRVQEPGVGGVQEPGGEEETCRGAESRSRGSEESRIRGVVLFTSPLFLRLHGLQRLGSTGTVRPLEPVRLDRVVLGARSRRSLRRAAAEHFTAGLLELCSPGQVLLARQGEPLLLGEDPPGQEQQLDLLVLDCSPVTQGRITADTSLVLTDCCDWLDPPGSAPSCRPLRLCVSDFAHYADGVEGGRSLLDNRKLLGSGFSGVLQALECRLDVCVVDARRRRLGADGVDVDSCVFVSKQLLLKLGLFNHEWLKLSTRGGGARERLVSVLVVDPMQSPDPQSPDPQSPDPQSPDEVGFISETLWFNMTRGDEIPETVCTLRMKRWRSFPPESGGVRSDSFCRSASPLFASELHIQPVVSPLYNDLSCQDALLSEHFRTPRLVSEGDVLTLPAHKHPDLLQDNADGIHRYTLPV
nr:uncharacterized protein LOC110002893 [Labrus bergylta]